ncbi:hypothetical protein GDO78_009705 [Eleutherodactylus coqui]|uniref:Abasic site processing protein HMCES n=1 Tax=Eleutherodactylus coqui TaxID=57060 RepID=A0A8J6KCP6_ELECQ|nr:hypothetical protein GDO78_009705 [Eleutherodactylus coqui]
MQIQEEMCGRTACTLAPEDISKSCEYKDKQGQRKCPQWRDGDCDKYQPSYNNSPRSNNPVLLSMKHFQKNADCSERVLAAMRWGLIPSWFTGTHPSKMQYNTSNCRSDTMSEKALYKSEARKDDSYVGGRRLLTMAGLFDCWEPPEGEDTLYSYTVITVDASKSINWIHDRMPAILDGDEEIRKWLDFGEVPAKEALKVIRPIESITCHPVSTVVNNARNNTPECVAPIILQKKEPALSASSKKMLAWLQNKSPKKEPSEEVKPVKLSQVALSHKKTSAELMHQWLKKEGEPSPKKPRR